MKHDRVRVTTFVGVSSADAFAVFTEEIDAWWGRGPRYRGVGPKGSTLRFEGGARGRLVESFVDGTEFEIGRVLSWEPGARLAFEWRSSNFTADQRTQVQVTFAAKNGGTEVVIEHAGWASIPQGHPVRHGEPAPAFIASMGSFWGDLATSYRQYAGRD